MNFLAHIYLSDDDKLLAVGNFIGDFVKGKQFEAFPKLIREGIILHRAIDSYTDSHSLTAEARTWMYPIFGKYAGIYLDVFYDYFLAANWDSYHNIPLRKYTHRFYLWLLQNYMQLPAEVRGFLPNMIATNRLYSYRSVKGIKRALNVMAAHTSLPLKTNEAILFLNDNHNKLNDNFKRFFAELQAYVKHYQKI